MHRYLRNLNMCEFMILIVSFFVRRNRATVHEILLYDNGNISAQGLPSHFETLQPHLDQRPVYPRIHKPTQKYD